MNKTLRIWEIKGFSPIEHRTKTWQRTTVLNEFTKVSARHLCERYGYQFVSLRELR